MSEDLERALNQLDSAKAGFDPGPRGGFERDEAAGAPVHGAIGNIVERLRAPFPGRMGADYWSSLHAERAEAASVIELLCSELAAARSQVALLSGRLADEEAAYNDLAEAVSTAEQRGYERAVFQVYEALRRDPGANAASLILAIGQHAAPPASEPRRGADELSRELDAELLTLKRNAGRLDDPA